MQITVTNVYNNTILPDQGFIAGHGQSFHIKSEKFSILYDAGFKGEELLNNMNILGIDPNEIDFLVLSHGHIDHTGGINDMIKNRTTEKILTIIGHPLVTESKGVLIKKRFRTKNYPITLPEIPEIYLDKVEFKLEKDSVKIASNVFTLGEVINRPEKDGTRDGLTHKENGKWVRDPIIDDLTLVLDTKEGLVLICGCCHAGVLNTCLKSRSVFNNKRIAAILGGTHMLRFTKEEVDHVTDVLKNHYGSPKLYLNHCTGNHIIDQLRTHFGEKQVQSLHVGTHLNFKC
jgi:7,8-dihydropterin-6-yl-methyl-4-(beta-D-ribofuranosyl)aminobenzene 5'-phosphate synthase